jgi:hypothetical protein
MRSLVQCFGHIAIFHFDPPLWGREQQECADVDEDRTKPEKIDICLYFILASIAIISEKPDLRLQAGLPVLPVL